MRLTEWLERQDAAEAEYASWLARLATSHLLRRSGMNKGTEVTHPIYGRGKTCSEPEAIDTHQWSGSAVWCVFYAPKTSIAAGWPYALPVSDLSRAAVTD